MTHTQILDIFKDMLGLEGKVEAWWTYGTDTIRVRVEGLDYDLIFTCRDDKTWSLQTDDMFPRWISVKERLPEKAGNYAVFNSKPGFASKFRYDVHLFDPDDEMVVKFWTVYSDYDYWCPLPEVPSDES